MTDRGKTYPAKTKVQQHFKEETNINRVVQRFNSGAIPKQDPQQLNFMDQYDAKSFHESQNMVMEIKSKFSLYPAKIRARFQNSPSKMLEFLSHEENMDEAVQLGLVEKVPGTEEKKEEKTEKSGKNEGKPEEKNTSSNSSKSEEKKEK